MEQEVHGPVEGTVVLWKDDEGWGALSSPAVNGEVWVLWSHVEVDQGYKTLSVGQGVTFTFETPGQDGYPHRAISVRPMQ